MTMRTAACAFAVALLAGTASFAVPAAAHSVPAPRSHAKRLYMSTVAVYDAGLRRGRANSSNHAYLRGFRDGTSSEAYSSRAYVVNPYAGTPVPVANPYAGYSPYIRDAGDAAATGGYASYDLRSTVYGDGFASDRYNVGYAPRYAPGYSQAYGQGYGQGYGQTYVPRGLMDVAVAPVATAPPLDARAAHFSYCAARYQSFDAASDTFLANDGNRYFCR